MLKALAATPPGSRPFARSLIAAPHLLTWAPERLGDCSPAYRAATHRPRTVHGRSHQRSLFQQLLIRVIRLVCATRVAGVPTQTDVGWLRGPYLSNASQYGSIEAFWSSIDDFTQGMRATAWQQYHDQYVERVGQEGLAAEAIDDFAGPADEVAAVVGFLASDQAGYITGETVHVNGGMYMG